MPKVHNNALSLALIIFRHTKSKLKYALKGTHRSISGGKYVCCCKIQLFYQCSEHKIFMLQVMYKT
uniref:Uncharacterized protein n=1 Tax=Rhizophora mucronata TaxID=61149 RepID=A0A2P2NI46_RHIMU